MNYDTPKMSHISAHKELHITRSYIEVMGASDVLARVKDPIAAAAVRGIHPLKLALLDTFKERKVQSCPLQICELGLPGDPSVSWCVLEPLEIFRDKAHDEDKHLETQMCTLPS